jgi:hypothetical protein
MNLRYLWRLHTGLIGTINSQPQSDCKLCSDSTDSNTLLAPSVENITSVVSVSSPRKINGDAILGDLRRLASLHVWPVYNIWWRTLECFTKLRANTRLNIVHWCASNAALARNIRIWRVIFIWGYAITKVSNLGTRYPDVSTSHDRGEGAMGVGL